MVGGTSECVAKFHKKLYQQPLKRSTNISGMLVITNQLIAKNCKSFPFSGFIVRSGKNFTQSAL